MGSTYGETDGWDRLAPLAGFIYAIASLIAVDRGL